MLTVFTRRDLKSIILCLLSIYKSEIGGFIGRTRLMKLLFLADYKSLKMRGKKLTNITWIKWYYGPFSRKVLDTLDIMEESGEVEVEHVEGIGHFYSISSEKDIEGLLKKDEEEILRSIVKAYGNLPLPKLLEKVYSLEEVAEKEIGEVLLK